MQQWFYSDRLSSKTNQGMIEKRKSKYKDDPCLVNHDFSSDQARLSLRKNIFVVVKSHLIQRILYMRHKPPESYNL